MATITRGAPDAVVQKLKNVLDEYEHSHANSSAWVMRQNPAAIWIQIVDPRFDDLSIGERHDDVWDFISPRLGDEDVQEISVLLLLTPNEQLTSEISSEFVCTPSSK